MIELGQIVNGTPNIQPHNADWAECGLKMISEALFGSDFIAYPPTNFENEVFELYPYWWGEETAEEAERVNFHHKKSGIQISWYKRIGRGMSGPKMPKDWHHIVAECLMSIPVREVDKNGNS